jgi:hypothetical protein
VTRAPTLTVFEAEQDAKDPLTKGGYFKCGVAHKCGVFDGVDMHARWPRVSKSHGPAMGFSSDVNRRAHACLRIVRHPMANYNAWRRKSRGAPYNWINYVNYVETWHTRT